MQAKYDSLTENKTWELIFTSENRQIITGQWYFKLNKNRNSHILKYKVRWVAHGLMQEKNVDFVKIFAVVVNLISDKCLFDISVKRKYKI